MFIFHILFFISFLIQQILCPEVCRKLNPVNAELTCLVREQSVNCNNPLRSGTRVRPKCLPEYKPAENETIVTEILCLEDGEWDNALFRCEPDCGVPFVPKKVPGMKLTYHDSPWHVAVYDMNSFTLICGGTIISPYLILTAAYCFFDENYKLINNVSNYEIMVSKVERDYSILDNEYTQNYKVREIYFHPEGHGVDRSNYLYDIAIMEVESKISLKPAVRTACIEWGLKERFNRPPGSTGKVVIRLPHGNYEKCSEILPGNITNDRFCAGNATVPTFRRGYLGGGLLFKKGSFYYLFGIISTVQRSRNNSYATFVDISFHIDFIRSIKNAVEGRILQQETQEGSCKLPLITPGRQHRIQCSKTSEPSICRAQSGQFVPIYTVITITCHEGYSFPDDNVRYSSICLSGVWAPVIANCSKICKQLNPINLELTCLYGGEEINCNQSLKAGARVYPTCLTAYSPQGGEPTYRRITCQEDGEWDNVLFRCTPECGIPFQAGEILLTGGKKAKYGDFPWHVAIYDLNTRILICGGTIISPYLIISAAHCFFNENSRTMQNAYEFEIMVSKVTRNYTDRENKDVQSYKIRHIHLHPQGYRGLATNHVFDIAILETVERIILKPSVRTACIDWTRKERFNPPPGTTGTVVGWGIDESDNPNGSDVLLAADLPFISYEKCQDIFHEPYYKQTITSDKFCAGQISGAGVKQGDSGGGLMFNMRSLYYLFGVVSVKPENQSLSIAAFTDISEYIEWISDINQQVERQRAQIERQTPLKTG